MDDHSHAVTVAEGFTDLDFAAEAVAFCAVGDCFVFKLDAKLAARLFRIRKQFCAVAFDLPRQRSRRGSPSVAEMSNTWATLNPRSVPAVRVCCVDLLSSGSSRFFGL